MNPNDQNNPEPVLNNDISEQPTVGAAHAPEPPVQAAVQPQQADQQNDLHEIFDQIAEKIIEQQEAIIGPIAVERARLVQALKVNWQQHDVDIVGNPQQAIDALIEQYKELFGQIAVQASKDAVASIVSRVPADQLPDSLK